MADFTMSFKTVSDFLYPNYHLKVIAESTIYAHHEMHLSITDPSGNAVADDYVSFDGDAYIFDVQHDLSAYLSEGVSNEMTIRISTTSGELVADDYTSTFTLSMELTYNMYSDVSAVERTETTAQIHMDLYFNQSKSLSVTFTLYDQYSNEVGSFSTGKITYAQGWHRVSSGVFTGLSPGEQYSFQITTTPFYTIYSVHFYTIMQRPSNFAWTSNVVKGAEIPSEVREDDEIILHPLTADEWNAMLDKIAEFYKYVQIKDGYNIVWTFNPDGYKVAQGALMLASDATDLRNQINKKLHNHFVGAKDYYDYARFATIESGTEITANFINALASGLNSIE